MVYDVVDKCTHIRGIEILTNLLKALKHKHIKKSLKFNDLK